MEEKTETASKLEELLSQSKDKGETETFITNSSPQRAYVLNSLELQTKKAQEIVDFLEGDYRKTIAKTKIKIEECDRTQRLCTGCTALFGATFLANYFLEDIPIESTYFGICMTGFTAVIAICEAYRKHKFNKVVEDSEDSLNRLTEFAYTKR